MLTIEQLNEQIDAMLYLRSMTLEAWRRKSVTVDNTEEYEADLRKFIKNMRVSSEMLDKLIRASSTIPV